MEFVDRFIWSCDILLTKKDTVAVFSILNIDGKLEQLTMSTMITDSKHIGATQGSEEPTDVFKPH